MHFARLGPVGGVDHRPLLHLRNLARHSDDDSRMHEHSAPVRLLDEVGEHLLGDFEVGDDAVLHGADGHNVARGAAHHLLGLPAHGFHLAGGLIDGNDRRFVDDDAFAVGKDQRVRGTQVNRQIR